MTIGAQRRNHPAAMLTYTCRNMPDLTRYVAYTPCWARQIPYVLLMRWLTTPIPYSHRPTMCVRMCAAEKQLPVHR